MKQQKVSNRSLDVLNHDLRSKIYELIKDRDYSTIDIAKEVNENRVNLYHHLQMLEKVGLIESYYNSERMKCFRLATMSKSNQNHSSNVKDKSNSSYEVLVINPTSENSNTINQLVNEILQIAGEKDLQGSDIIQVQVLYQSSSV